MKWNHTWTTQNYSCQYISKGIIQYSVMNYIYIYTYISFEYEEGS